MSRDSWNIDQGPLRGLYRDRENGWLFGVCAGLAEFANFRTGTVRIVTFICLFFFFLPTALVYIGATLLLREKPLVYSGRHEEYDFWRRRSRENHWSHL